MVSAPSILDAAACYASYCKECSILNPTSCSTCHDGYTNKNGYCFSSTSTCRVPNCKACQASNPDFCATCDSYYRANELGKCVCYDCYDDYCDSCNNNRNYCDVCMVNYWRTEVNSLGYNRCIHKCDTQYCARCEGTTIQRCTACKAGYTYNSIGN